MNKKKVGGLLAIVSGCIISARSNVPYEDVLSHGLTTSGAYIIGKENMRQYLANTRFYTRAGLKKLGIYDEQQ